MSWAFFGTLHTHTHTEREREREKDHLAATKCLPPSLPLYGSWSKLSQARNKVAKNVMAKWKAEILFLIHWIPINTHLMLIMSYFL